MHSLCISNSKKLSDESLKFPSADFCKYFNFEDKISRSYPVWSKLALSETEGKKTKFENSRQIVVLCKQFKNMDLIRFGKTAPMWPPKSGTEVL